MLSTETSLGNMQIKNFIEFMVIIKHLNTEVSLDRTCFILNIIKTT